VIELPHAFLNALLVSLIIFAQLNRSKRLSRNRTDRDGHEDARALPASVSTTPMSSADSLNGVDAPTAARDLSRSPR